MDGRSWDVAYPIRDCRWIEGRVCVIYDYMAGPKGTAFRNLEAFDPRGHKLWTAENPTSDPADAYVEFQDGPAITAWNFACYSCRIDPTSGRMLQATFTK